MPELEESMSTQNVIDLPTFETLKTTMGVDFIEELVDTYCEDTPRLIAEIQQALAAQNVELFRRMAHSIKSSSYSMGALKFGALAKELEMMAKENNLDGAAAKVEQLIGDYAHVEKALRGINHG